MTDRTPRTCSVCRTGYLYCPRCQEDADKPNWYFAFCSENCLNIYDTLAAYCDGRISDIEAKERIIKLDLSKKDDFGESYKEVIAKVMKAKTPVKKIEYKKEGKMLDKISNETKKDDIVTETENAVDGNVE